MKNFLPMLGASVRNSYRNKAALGIMFGLTLLFAALLSALIGFFALIPALDKTDPDLNEVGRWFSLIVYGTGLLAMGMNLNVFTANNLVKEKEARIVESLLAAPVGVRKLWLAKSMAVFLPGLLFCEACSLAMYLAVNCFIITGRTGFFISPLLILNGFLLVPIIYLPLSALVLLVGLSGNPVSGNIIAQVFFAILIPLVINLVTRAGLDPASFQFSGIHLALAGVTALALLGLQFRLTKERIVLSCRK